MNLPNKITMFRICLIPVFLLVLLTEWFGGYTVVLSVSIFAIASLTDALDGYIARSRNLITNFGKLMDPLADKLLVNSALIAFVGLAKLPAWVVIIIVAREFLITGVRLLALEKNIVIAAANLAKYKTISQMLLIIYILLDLQWTYNTYVTTALTILATVLAVVSGVEYIWRNLHVIHE